MVDIGFISKIVGSNEGQSNWDYMADVFPDRKIDMKDAGWAAKNFGKKGTYIENDLSGVTVTFDTGDISSPDDVGFVAIPQNATGFTVKRNGNTIGALITFW